MHLRVLSLSAIALTLTVTVSEPMRAQQQAPDSGVQVAVPDGRGAGGVASPGAGGGGRAGGPPPGPPPR